MPPTKYQEDNFSESNFRLPSSDFHLRSEEVQEILTRVPNWMIRWGNVVILLLLALVMVISWFIKYPDIITTKIIITTQTPPEKLVARTSGRIEAILVADRQNISQNIPLAVIENSANFKDIFLLKSIVDTLNLNKNPFPFEVLQTAQLGEVESTFAIFQKEYIANQLNIKLQPFKVEGKAQGFEYLQLKERLTLLDSQKNITQNELVLQKSDLDRHEKLYTKGVISAQEIEKQRLIYLQAEKNYKSLLSSVSQMKSSLNDLSRNTKATIINETKENVILERNVIQAFYELKKAIKNWELNYVLRSSIAGQVTFLQIWTPSQNVAAGDNVFAVIPSNIKNYIGKVKAPAQNSGKIKAGQEVNIRLANFPDREFGMIKGTIKNISLTPDKEGNLLIDVSLPQGLKTSYKKQIAFQQEMSGTADIVTEDLRLIEKLLYQFRDVFKR